MEYDIKALVESLTSVTDRMSFYRLVTEHVSIALLAFCYDLLDVAVARTPYRTGELRSSGQVKIRTGAKQLSGAVFSAIDVRADKSGNWELRQHIDSIKRPAGLISVEISFERTDEGDDIALWAHEDLGFYEDRPKAGTRRAPGEFYAVKPGKYGIGTGPKYLESPYMETIGELQADIQRAVDTAIGIYNAKTGQRVRRR
jgi:hypothetical protein